MQPEDLKALQALETQLRSVENDEGRDAALRAAAAWNGTCADREQIETWVRRTAEQRDVTLATWIAGDSVDDLGTVGLDTAAALERPRTSATSDNPSDEATARPQRDPGAPLARTVKQDDTVELFDDRYRIVRMLGEGGFGRVLLVEDTLHSGQLRALKTILPQRQASDQFEHRFRNEIQVMRSMQHAGIPQIFNDGRTSGGEFYFTMAYVNGRPFSEVMKQEGAMDPARVARVLREVVEVLCYAHDRGVVHRDLKPDNILLQNEGDAEEAVRVLDFGIAKILEREGDLEGVLSMQTQAPIGTPHYMSPEQVAGRGIDGSTDIYALGILVYQFLSGKYPFKGTTYFELMSARLHEEPEPLSPKLEPEWARSLVPRLMARDPKQRPTAPELLAELDGIIAGGSGVAEPPKGRTKLIAVAAGFSLVAAAAVALALGGEPDPGSSAELASGNVEAADSGADIVDDDAPSESESTASSEETPSDPSEQAVQSVEGDDATLDRSPVEDTDGSEAQPIEGTSTTDGSSLSGADSSEQEDQDEGQANAEPPAAPMEEALPASDEPAAKAPEPTATAAETQAVEPTKLAPPEGTAAAGDARSPDGYPLRVTHAASGLDFVYVAPGKWQGGGTVTQVDEPFYLCRTEVSRAAFARYADERRLDMPPVPRSVVESDALPVTNLTRDEAAHFAEWAGAALPSVAQLRWAAIGPDPTRFPWGDTFDPALCNTRGDADGFANLAPADSFDSGASWCGAINLCGNAWEWTAETDQLFGGSHASEGESTSPMETEPPFIPKKRSDLGFRIVLPIG